MRRSRSFGNALLLASLVSLAGFARAATYTQKSLEGNWTGTWLTTGTLNFTVDAAGNFTGTGFVGASVTVAGHLDVVSSSGNVTGFIDFDSGGAVFDLLLTLTSPGLSGKPNRLMGSDRLRGTPTWMPNGIDISGGTDVNPPVVATLAIQDVGYVLEGASVTFHATGADQFGMPMSPVPVSAWSVSGGGTVGSGGTFTATQAGGPFTVTATAGAVTATAAFMVAANTPPAFASEPSVSPNPVVVGSTAAFTAAASDAEGQPVTYAWDFGDGVALAGSSVTHFFQAPGAYTVTVAVSDGHSHSTRSFTVNVLPPPGRLFIGQLKASLSFARSGRDSVTLKASVAPLAPAFPIAGQRAELDVGGVVAAFDLNARGQGRSEEGSMSLKFRRAAWTLQASLKGDFASAWAGLGMVNADVGPTSVTFPVTLNLGGARYAGARPLSYKAKKDATGRAK